MKKINILLVLVFIAVTFSKCHVMKRTYRNGYYIAWDKKASHLKNDNTLKKEDAELNDILDYTEPILSEPLLASTEQSIIPNKKNKIIEPVAEPIDSCGDIIKLKNGDEIVAKVLEVSQTTIKYKKCNNLDGPLMVESIDNIFMIKYVNGSKDVFNKPAKQIVNSPKKEDAQTGEKKYNKAAVTSFIFSFFFMVWGVSCIFSLIFAIKALRQMKKESGKYKGKALAMTGLIISAFVLGVILLAILSAIL